MCLLSLLFFLGVWQLNRAEQKREFLILEEQRLASDALELSEKVTDQPEVLRYRKVIGKGTYDSNHQFLLDNQISEGKAGYFVLTPFLLQGQNKAVLVNRGWVPSGADRSVLPALHISQEATSITGRINNFPSVGIKLAGAEIPSDNWPSLVQVANSTVLEKKLDYPLFEFQIELDKELPDGFKREWRISTVMLPEQHIAYAIQWFLLSLTLSIIFIWYSLKNNDEKSKK
jgi:surfeit locus 1 family protein